MILSEENNYVFVQYPHTGCTAVGGELVKYYGGTEILSKHAKWHDFLRRMKGRGREYYVFSSVRNPMDEVASLYFKLKHDHEGYSRPENWRVNGGWLSWRGLRQFRYVHDQNASFDAYLRKFFVLPAVNWTILDHREFDYVMRFERLQEEFSTVLHHLGLQQVRSLPVANPTFKEDPVSLFERESTRRLLVRAFHPLMAYWGYEFPESWCVGSKPDPFNRLAFGLNCAIRTAYWRLRS